MTRPWIMAMVVSLLLCSGNVLADETEALKSAVPAAQQWLNLVDQGHYGPSWNQAATHFKDAITQALWEQTMQAGRAPLGPVISRIPASRSYQTTLPGAPDGEYLVIQYHTEFKNKASAIETITPMKDKDGRWRVSGYYIK